MCVFYKFYCRCIAAVGIRDSPRRENVKTKDTHLTRLLLHR